jgi:hypothetical protein
MICLTQSTLLIFDSTIIVNEWVSDRATMRFVLLNESMLNKSSFEDIIAYCKFIW